MPTVFVLLLLVFWLFLAYRALQRGDVTMAIVFAAVGVALTIYRFTRRKAPPGP